jgi:hypothetical protein
VSIPKRAFHGSKVRLGIPIFFEKNLDWASGRQGNKEAGSTYSCTVCNKNNMQV